MWRRLRIYDVCGASRENTGSITLGTRGDDRTQLVAVDKFGSGGLVMAGEARNLLDGHAVC